MLFKINVVYYDNLAFCTVRTQDTKKNYTTGFTKESAAGI